MTELREFFSGLIDYAGLFPPASQDMEAAVREYATHSAGQDADLLGRFVVPVTRLEEFVTAISRHVQPNGAKWTVSAIAAEHPDVTRTAIDRFNSSQSVAVCDSVEMPVASYDDIVQAVAAFPDDLALFLEVSPHSDPIALLREIALTPASAKLRTGGVVESAIPASEQVVRFLEVCVEEGVPFKATAGLHHAIRGRYPLTYESSSASAVMFGYLNIFLGAAFCAAGSSRSAVLGVVEETDPARFRVDARGVWWRDHVVVHEQLAVVRQTVASSFGSCSFTEPVAEARSLKLI
jgi:hypothetical protein